MAGFIRYSKNIIIRRLLIYGIFFEKKIRRPQDGSKTKIADLLLETNYMRQQEISTKKAAKRGKLLIRRLSVFLILTVALSYLFISTIVSSGAVLEAKREKRVSWKKRLLSWKESK